MWKERKRMDALERCVLQWQRERESVLLAMKTVQALEARLAALEEQVKRLHEQSDAGTVENGADRVSLSQILNEYLYGDGGDGKEVPRR